MASLTTNTPPSHAKRQRTSLKQSTIEALQEERAEPIKIGTFVLPAGFESACGIMTKIYIHLDIRSLCNVKRSSLIQQCRKAFRSEDFERVRDIALSLSYKGRRSINELILAHPALRLYVLIEAYKREFPRCTQNENIIPTPIVCACQYGRMDDVESFVNLHPFHQYITNRGVNVPNGNMTLKEMVNQLGKDSHGSEWTPLIAAAGSQNFQLVQFLIEQGEADPNIANSTGWNALHLAATGNRANAGLILLLVDHMTLDNINKKSRAGYTPLDYAYGRNDSPIKQEIITLLRSKGGKANAFDENGIAVGKGNGDLNH